MLFISAKLFCAEDSDCFILFFKFQFHNLSAEAHFVLNCEIFKPTRILQKKLTVRTLCDVVIRTIVVIFYFNHEKLKFLTHNHNLKSWYHPAYFRSTELRQFRTSDPNVKNAKTLIIA